MTRTLSIRELRSALSSLEDVLAESPEVIITRRGEPIARLSPLEHRPRMPSHRELRESMPMMPVGSEVLIREDRDAR